MGRWDPSPGAGADGGAGIEGLERGGVRRGGAFVPGIAGSGRGRRVLIWRNIDPRLMAALLIAASAERKRPGPGGSPPGRGRPPPTGRNRLRPCRERMTGDVRAVR